jgi:hypothetical protein
MLLMFVACLIAAELCLRRVQRGSRLALVAYVPLVAALMVMGLELAARIGLAIIG